MRAFAIVLGRKKIELQWVDKRDANACYRYADPMGRKTQAATESRLQTLGIPASLSFDKSTQGACTLTR
jgi:hypothetical protein